MFPKNGHKYTVFYELLDTFVSTILTFWKSG